MKKYNAIIVGVFLVLLISTVLLCYFSSTMLRKNIQKDMEEILDEVLIINKQGDKIKSEVAQIKKQVDTINEEVSQIKQHIESIDGEVSHITENLDNLENDIEFLEEETLEDIKSQISDESSKIVFLEKEIIKQASGAYDNYNFYYTDIGNYSVRFLKEYLYETLEPMPPEEDWEGAPGELIIFLNETKEDYLRIYLWHSFGVSTGSDSPIKLMNTDEGEIIEYVESESESVVYMDFGFENYTLKLRVIFNNKENDAVKKVKVKEIVRTIMFYDSQMKNR